LNRISTSLPGISSYVCISSTSLVTALTIFCVQCSLYFEDGGDAVRRELSKSSEELHPLGQEALDAARRHTIEESCEVRARPVLLIASEQVEF
jgi:hypothetical protein